MISNYALYKAILCSVLVSVVALYWKVKQPSSLHYMGMKFIIFAYLINDLFSSKPYLLYEECYSDLKIQEFVQKTSFTLKDFIIGEFSSRETSKWKILLHSKST